MNCDPEGVGLGETCSIQPQGWGSRPRHTEVLSFYQESLSLFLGVCQRILEDLKAEHETGFFQRIKWQSQAKMGSETDRLGLTVRQTNWETGRHTDLEKGRQKDRQTHRQKDIDRQTERRVERLWIIDLEARYRQKRLLSCEKADQNTQLIKGKTNRAKDIKK